MSPRPRIAAGADRVARRPRRGPSAPPTPPAPRVAPPPPAHAAAPVHDLEGMLRRLHLPTVRRLFAELATRAEAEGMSYHTYLETLMAEEIAHRTETRIARAVRRAHFPFLRTIDDFNFTFQTALKRQMLGSYLGPELVSDGRLRRWRRAPALVPAWRQASRSQFPRPSRSRSP